MQAPFSIHVRNADSGGYVVTVCASAHATQALDSKLGERICAFADTKMASLWCKDLGLVADTLELAAQALRDYGEEATTV